MSNDQAASIEVKRERQKELRNYHQPLLMAIGVSNAMFYPKSAFYPNGKNEKYVAFFKSEISSGQDIYMEFVDRDNVPTEEGRELYKWKWNPHYETEYEQTDPTSTKNRFLIPIGELSVIQPPQEPEKKEGEKLSTKDVKVEKKSESEFKLEDPNMDLPLNQITIRDLAAIMLNKPCSHKVWLNDIIKDKHV